MRVITSFILSPAMFFFACTAAFASGVAWQPITERQDFRIGDKAVIIESALNELLGVYGSGLNIEELEKGISYVNSMLKYTVRTVFCMTNREVIIIG